ncbi:MAG: PrsW family intramembrane metalloprotease [Candidatus Nealsonbacteria bacterium]|nr:PrsW family intramembrane metalloprotease [Candidatus Nealsonbacteria bacterium]
MAAINYPLYAFFGLALADQLKNLTLPHFLNQIIYIFLGIALIEEFFKYLIVKKKILKDPEFDEPTDVMLYMIISALGFAALENLIILFPLANPFQFLQTSVISVFRFVGATFLHALASGVLGYFMAMSFFRPKNRKKLLFMGFFASVSLHGLYDLSIIEVDNGFKFAVPIVILLGLTVFVSLSFKKVDKLKSICNLASQGNSKHEARNSKQI